MRSLRAVFRFRAPDDPKRLMPTLQLLLRTLRILRLKDPGAELTITPDLEPPHYDADGD
jgi:hypothetical protein